MRREFDKAQAALKSRDRPLAEFYAGALTHYIGDLAQFCHVMGNESHWGSENMTLHLLMALQYLGTAATPAPVVQPFNNGAHWMMVQPFSYQIGNSPHLIMVPAGPITQVTPVSVKADSIIGDGQGLLKSAQISCPPVTP